VLAALWLIPQFWVSDLTLLIVLRFGLGLFSGGVLPTLRTALAEEARADAGLANSFGSIYGFSGSAAHGGMAIGSAVATLLGSLFGLAFLYASSGVAMALIAAWWLASTQAGRPVPRDV
jgi:DHA1 family multidrug resistance protein-like MFS transporter